MKGLLFKFDVWEMPKPADGDRVCGILIDGDGRIGEATVIYGTMLPYFENGFGKDLPAIGIGEPLTRDAQQKYMARAARDIFGHDITTYAIPLSDPSGGKA